MELSVRVRKLIVFVVVTSTMLCSCNIENKNEILPINQGNVQDQKESLTFRITWKSYSGRGEAIKKL